MPVMPVSLLISLPISPISLISPAALPERAASLLLWALPAAALAYLCGCSNGAVIVSRYILRDDVRRHGSGNAGLTNFYRTFGGPLTLLVISFDVFKMIAAVWLVHRFFGQGIVWTYWAGLCCLLGHMFPVTFRFRGGKGILSGGTLAIMIDWRVALVVWGGFLILVVLTRYVSLGSLWAAASFPFVSWYCFPQYPLAVVLAVLTGGLVFWQHRANLGRLLRGDENKFSIHPKKAKGSERSDEAKPEKSDEAKPEKSDEPEKSEEGSP